MFSLAAIAAVLLVGALALKLAQISRLRRLSLERIGFQAQDALGVSEMFGAEEIAIKPYPRRFRFIPFVAAALSGASLLWLTDLPGAYAIGSAVLVGAIAHLLEARSADQRTQRIEEQLADAIDLMVASLRAGSALLASLEATLREAKMPMRAELETLAGRIRVGEDPRIVVRELAVRVPLESFRLFSHTLLVHWETGGSLAPALRTVGGTVRDRLEVSRRISAQAVESQISVIAVMAVTYGLAVFMRSSNPEPFHKLIYSLFGSYVAAALMVLQAIGMVWIWRMSRIRF